MIEQITIFDNSIILEENNVWSCCKFLVDPYLLTGRGGMIDNVELLAVPDRTPVILVKAKTGLS